MKRAPAHRSLVLFGVVLCLLAGGSGCDLNPQPLPPGHGVAAGPGGAEDAGQEDATGASSSGGLGYFGSDGSVDAAPAEQVGRGDAAAADASPGDAAINAATDAGGDGGRDAERDATDGAWSDGAEDSGQESGE